MIPVSITNIQIGSITEREFFTLDGELLISKGVVFSTQHYDALKRRNIDTVFIKDDDTDSDLQKIFSTKFKKLGDLEIEDSLIGKKECIEFDFSELTSLTSGREGLALLLESKKATALDSVLKMGKMADSPTGVSLRSKVSKMSSADRTQEYKNQIVSTYENSIEKARFFLDLLARGESVGFETIRTIVTKFIDIYLSDKEILLNMSNTKTENDDYIYHHSLNVCILSINIAAAHGYNEQQVIEIGTGGLLHDVGMLLLPKEIRTKQGGLTEDEWFDIQKHPILGLHLLEKINHLPESIPYVAYQTHERENGRGYPKQRSNRLIHKYAKIVAIADIFEALSSPRKHRQTIIPYKAMESLIKMTRQGLISGEFVKSFLEYASLFPVGSIIELSNGCLGKVIGANGGSFAKPIVCIFTDSNKKKLDSDKVYKEDLSKNTSIQIVRAHASSLAREDLMLGF